MRFNLVQLRWVKQGCDRCKYQSQIRRAANGFVLEGTRVFDSDEEMLSVLGSVWSARSFVPLDELV
jgi:hypothetical protein